MAPDKQPSDNTPSELNFARSNLIKKLRIRAWRRGTREMDLLLGNFIDRLAKDLSTARLSQFKLLLEENDLDILNWVTGQENSPPRFATLVVQIKNANSFNI